MATDRHHAEKRDIKGGSADAQQGAEPNDEGADPTCDIRKQNQGEATGPDVGDAVAHDGGRPQDVRSDDPHKVEKLAKAGRDDLDPNAGAD
jgi:hypothetical protein